MTLSAVAADSETVTLPSVDAPTIVHAPKARDPHLPPEWDRAHCGPVCTVRVNNGGYIEDFRRQADIVVRDRITLRIDGPCASACTMLADKARSNVCVTPRAVMQFHQAYSHIGGQTVRYDPSKYYSPRINAWVSRRGGYPGLTADDKALLPMTYRHARRFWKAC